MYIAIYKISELNIYERMFSMVEENKALNAPTMKRTKLTFPECYSTSMGMIIGAGIITSTGIAIGYTGTGVWLGYLLAGLSLLIVYAPGILGGSVVPKTSANYFMSSCISKKMGGFYIMISFLAFLNIAFMGIAFGQYVMSITNVGNLKMWSLICLTIFFLANFLEQKVVAKIQAIMTLLLIASWISFILLGLPKVDWGVFSFETTFANGLEGMAETVATLLFAMGGGLWLVDAGGRIENPERNVVLGNLVTVGTGIVLFGIISIVAVGVLPLSDVVNQPLTLVANAIYPGNTYILFVIGGALIALSTTINARYLDSGNKLIRSAQEGWFPETFAKRNKNAVPYIFMTIVYLISTLPIILGMNIASLSRLAAATVGIVAIIPNIGFIFLIRKYPEEWKASKWYMPKPVLILLYAISTLVLIILTYRNLRALSPVLWVVLISYIVGSYIYASHREKNVVELNDGE